MKLVKLLKSTSFFLSVHTLSKLQRHMLKSPGNNHPHIWLRNFYKDYPRYPQIKLPISEEIKDSYLIEAIVNRQSAQQFSKKTITLERLSKILFFSAGINRLGKRNIPSKRMYPSAAARYPLEIYVLQQKDIKGCTQGIYHYNVKMHVLERLSNEFTEAIRKKIGGEVNSTFIENASTLLVITAVFGRTEIKYGKSSYKLILLEAGHLAQNIILLASAYKCATRPLGGFVDDEVNTLLQLDEEKEQAIYIIALGKARTS